MLITHIMLTVAATVTTVETAETKRVEAPVIALEQFLSGNQFPALV